jgi:hypothetical protein
VTLVDANALALNASTISGTLNVTTNGALTDNGALVVTGASTFAVGTANDITLDTATNNFSTVTITNANNATLVDVNAIDLGGASVSNTLNVTGTSITDSGSLTGISLIAKTLNNAGGAITLNDSNHFSTIDLQALNGAGTAPDTGAITYVDNSNINVSQIATASTINLTANGTINASGNIRGTTLTTSSAGETNLTFGHNVTGFNAFNSGTGAIQLTNTGALSITGLTQSATGGDITINNTGTITTTGTMTTNNKNLILTGSSTLAVNSAINAGNGNVNLTSTGDMSDSAAGNITANQLTAKTLNTTGSDIVLDSGLHTANTIDFRARNSGDTANALGILSFSANSGFDVAAAQTTSTVTLSGTGALTQSNSMTGTTLTATTLNDAGRNITFNNTGNTFTNVSLQTRNGANSADVNGTIQYVDADSINLSNLRTSGNATITANNGAITDSAVALTVGGTLSAVSNGASGGITINSTTNQISGLSATTQSGNIVFTGNTVALNVSGMTTAGGNITLSNTGNVTLAASSSVASNGGSITLTDTGTLGLNNNASITSSNGTVALTITDLSVASSADINAGSGGLTITQNTVGGTIGLGASAGGDLNISNTELHRFTSSTFNLNAPNSGFIIVDGITPVSTISGLMTLTANTGSGSTITFQGGASEFTMLTATAQQQLIMNANVTNNSGVLTLTSSQNTWSVGTGATVTSNGGITFTGRDIALNGNLNAGSGAISITSNLTNGVIGLGQVSGAADMTISGSELQRMSAGALTVNAPSNGRIDVYGVTASQSQNVGAVTLLAQSGTTGSVTFQDSPSTFQSLAVSADDGVTINAGAGIITSAGDLTLNGDTGGGAGSRDYVALQGNLTSAGTLTLSALRGGILINSNISLTSVGNMTFNDAVNGANNLTLNAGSTGNIAFNSTVGATTPLNQVSISNAAVAALGSSFKVTGSTSITANSGSTSVFAATGTIAVGALTLTTNTANLFGTVAGLSNQAAIAIITLGNTITANTHFFDGIDMYNPPPPTPTPTPKPTPSLTAGEASFVPQVLFPPIYNNQADTTSSIASGTNDNGSLVLASQSIDNSGQPKSKPDQGSGCTNVGTGITICSK